MLYVYGYKISTHQPDMAVNPARGRLTKGKCLFVCFLGGGGKGGGYTLSTPSPRYSVAPVIPLFLAPVRIGYNTGPLVRM